MNLSALLLRTTATLALALPLAACGAPSPAATPSAAAPSAPSVAGHWVGACSPMSPTQGSTVDFQIGATDWAIDYVVYGDSACSTKFLTVHIEGPYAIGATSTLVPGANEAKFGFTKKTITPHVDAAAQYLSSAGACGQPSFAAGVAKDVSATGCAGLGQRPIATCDADYDLAQVTGDTLTFGARPADNDLCSPEKRPTALSKVSVHRK